MNCWPFVECKFVLHSTDTHNFLPKQIPFLSSIILLATEQQQQQQTLDIPFPLATGDSYPVLFLSTTFQLCNANENCYPRASKAAPLRPSYFTVLEKWKWTGIVFLCPFAHPHSGTVVVAINYRIITVVTLSWLCAVQIRKSDPNGISVAKLWWLAGQSEV